MRRAGLALAGVALAGLALAGCSGGDEDPEAANGSNEVSPAAGPRDEPPAPGTSGSRSAQSGTARPPRERARLEPARCPPDLAGCRTASGRIVYVERVDPDGDGDAHFVLLSREGITGPGMSVIDVKKSLRPSPLPGPGDRISAAGTVATGSYGQRQIEAVVLRVAR